jgi:hypothetical protein
VVALLGQNTITPYERMCLRAERIGTMRPVAAFTAVNAKR